jgi:hypothetical protein
LRINTLEIEHTALIGREPMVALAIQSKQQSRELRRRVVARARVWAGSQWSDACILNVSSRGLLIQTSRPIPEGSSVEILRGDHLIVACVMWSNAGRSGLKSEQQLPVEDILSLEQSRALQLIASNGLIHDRRRKKRGVVVDPRLRGRAMEFLAIGAIAASLAIGMGAMAERALSGPLASASAALGG